MSISECKNEWMNTSAQHLVCSTESIVFSFIPFWSFTRFTFAIRFSSLNEQWTGFMFHIGCKSAAIKKYAMHATRIAFAHCVCDSQRTHVCSIPQHIRFEKRFCPFVVCRNTCESFQRFSCGAMHLTLVKGAFFRGNFHVKLFHRMNFMFSSFYFLLATQFCCELIDGKIEICSLLMEFVL